MTAVTIVTRTLCIVPRGPARRTVSGVQIIGVYQPRGIAMVTMIVVMDRMNHPSTASQRAVRVSVTYLRATMAIVYLEFTSVTETTIVWIIPTRT